MIKAVIFDMYETLITHYRSPLYFSEEMAADAGISPEKFQKHWRSTERERTIGQLSFEAVIEDILKENHCYTPQLAEKIIKKRKARKRELFLQLHPDILPMLQQLKSSGRKIGLISNCFSEEVDAIRESPLYPYFDAPFLSYEQGVQKPDKEIFIRCMKHLSVSPEECLYVGDGGSRELETARFLGMQPLQAVWYLKEGTMQPTGRKEDFAQAEVPLDVLNYLNPPADN